MVDVQGNTIIINSERASADDKIDFATAISRLEAEGNHEIRLDLSNTVYLPSELMGLLMWKKRELGERGTKIIISAISDPLRNTFDNAMISSFLELNTPQQG